MVQRFRQFGHSRAAHLTPRRCGSAETWSSPGSWMNRHSSSVRYYLDGYGSPCGPSTICGYLRISSAFSPADPGT